MSFHCGRRFDIQDERLREVVRRLLAETTPSLLPLLDDLVLAVSSNFTVLITGEIGTGRKSLARLIHDCSPEREQPFEVVPAGSLPGHLVRSELFGNATPLFGGPDRFFPGKLALARTGTVLLDEVDSFEPDQQAQFIRVIEVGEYEPVGSSQTHTCQARIMATGPDGLDEAARQGTFSWDFFRRLNVLPLRLPPLRQRVPDLAPLTRDLTARLATKFGKEVYDVSPEALTVLERYPWPGNLRQLETAIRQAVLVSTGTELLVPDLPYDIRRAAL